MIVLPADPELCFALNCNSDLPRSSCRIPSAFEGRGSCCLCLHHSVLPVACGYLCLAFPAGWQFRVRSGINTQRGNSVAK